MGSWLNCRSSLSNSPIGFLSKKDQFTGLGLAIKRKEGGRGKTPAPDTRIILALGTERLHLEATREPAILGWQQNLIGMRPIEFEASHLVY